MVQESKVLIGIITGEYARRADFYDYFNLLNKPPNSFIIMCHDRSPAKGRNLIIDAAKEHNCSHVLFVDDDMAYKEDALTRLLSHDKDIVSGLYLSRAYPHPPVIFDIADEDGRCFPMYLTNDNQGLVPIAASGFGFLLVKMSVFELLEKPYIRLGELDSEHWCDDIGFFNRLRKAGFKSYCDMDCRVGHMGTMIIWPNQTNKGEWMIGYDTNGTGMLNTPAVYPEHKYDLTGANGDN